MNNEDWWEVYLHYCIDCPSFTKCLNDGVDLQCPYMSSVIEN